MYFLSASFCTVVTNSFLCVPKGQKWSSDILTKQSKPSLVKSTSKLFFVSRLRGKKYKSGGSSKVLQDTSNTLDTNQTAAQGPQKVQADNHTYTHSCPFQSLQLLSNNIFSFISDSVLTCSETRATLIYSAVFRATVWMTSAVQYRIKAAGYH